MSRCPTPVGALLPLALVACGGLGRPTPTPTPTPWPEAEAVEAAVARAVADGWSHAARVATVRGDTVRTASFGDWAPATAGGGSDRVEIASCTKLFTAVLAAEAVRRGDVAPTDTLGALLPDADLHPSLAAVSLEDLATHTAGLPMWPVPPPADDPFLHALSEDGLRDALRTLAPDPDWAGRWRYANTHAALLGRAVAQRAGQPYPALAASWLLQPLGMDGTGFDTAAAPAPGRARGHDAKGRPAAPQGFGVLGPARGALSTVDDLARFAQATLQAADGRREPAVLAAIQATLTPDHAGHAWGWWIPEGHPSRREHNGFSPGFVSHVGVDLAHGVGVVVVFDTHQKRLAPFASGLLDPLTGEGPAPSLPRTRRPAPEALAPHVGTYALSPEATLAVRVVDDHLELQLGSNPPAVLVAGVDGAFHLQAELGTVTFAEGSPSPALTLRLGGHGMVAERVDATPDNPTRRR